MLTTEWLLTFKMCKCTKCSAGTIASVLNVVTFGRFVDLGVELLLCAGVTVLTIVTTITVNWITPFFSNLDCRTRGGSILVLAWTSPPVLVVVKLRTCIPLPEDKMGFDSDS